MRIALAAPDCHRQDGQARYVSELATGLARRGHEVDVWSVGFADTEAPGLRHRALRVPFASAVRLRFFLYARTLTRVLDPRAYDRVHTVGAAHPAAQVVTVQFCQAAWREFLDSPAGREQREDWLRTRLGAVVAGREAAAFRAAPALIAVSRRVADDVTRLCGRSRPSAVIPNGVDLDRFQPGRRDRGRELRAALGIPGEAFLVGFLGEFARKNLATVLEALATVRAPAWLLAAGPSDPQPFHALAQQLGISGRVRLLPRTAEPERLLAALDAFVFPTLYEPFGMAPLEAAAAGVPVLVSRRAGFAEWITAGRDGTVLDDPLDAALLARELDELAAAPALRRARGEAARTLALGFSWDSIVERTLAVYGSS